MSKIITIAWKDTLLQFSSWSQWLFFIILPVVFITILGQQSGSSNEGFALAIVDDDASDLAADLITQLDAEAALDPQILPLADAQRAFDDGEIEALLHIKAGFETALVVTNSADLNLQLRPNSNNSLAVQQTIQATVAELGRTIAIASNSTDLAAELVGFDSLLDRERHFVEVLEVAEEAIAATPPLVNVTSANTTDELDELDIATHQTAGQMITWVLIPLLGTSGLFAFERGYGTLRRLLTTPTRKATFLLGTITGQLTLGLVQMGLLVGFGMLVMGVSWGNLGGVALLLFAFGLAAVALGTTLGTFVKTEAQASGLSIMFGMLMALLGGCWMPIEIFPDSAKTFANILPTRWAMRGLLDLSLRNASIIDIAPFAGVLFAFAAIFFVIGVVRFRYE